MTPGQLAPADLARCGRALTGSDRWRRPLADMLGCDDRLVRRWASGEAPVQSWAEKRLRELVAARQRDLAALAEALDA
jgi:hypothetical protein